MISLPFSSIQTSLATTIMRLKSPKLTDLSGEEEKASNISTICYSTERVNNVGEIKRRHR